MSIQHAITKANLLHGNLTGSLGRTGRRMGPLTMSGGLVVRDALSNIIYEDGGAYTLNYHAEIGLLARLGDEVRNNGLNLTNANLYLYVYYTPCNTCYGRLRQNLGVLQNVNSRTLGYSVHFVGKSLSNDAYKSDGAAVRAMRDLQLNGWTVGKWRLNPPPPTLLQNL